ncbi:MAG: hypothetical protein IH874_06365 [Candidatus Dadabacteria bacterium]|nr:hypothetical protein [Candidatus Dadabacteria bacterium]
MDVDIREEILSKRPERLPIWFLSLLLLFVAAGVAAFITQITGPKADEAWQIFLVNFIFWTGIAQGGVVFSCTVRVTRGKWGPPLMRISESFGAFLPVSFVLLIVLFLGKDHILPYATQDYHNKELWLNMPFVIGRHVVGLAILFSLSLLYLYYSLRQDLGGAGEKLKGLAGWIASSWGGEEEREKLWSKLLRLAPAIVLLFTVSFSFISWDFMMSLDPHWFSTLFGPYYFVASFLGAIGMTIVLSIMVKNRLGLEAYITPSQHQDMGKLMFGFSLAWTYMFFSQFLVIWYANMPEETVFLIKRVQEQPFKTVSWVVICCCFFFPLVSLLPRTNKVVAPIFAFIAAVSLSGLWLEKFVLVVPSFTHHFHISIVQAVITLGFLSAFILVFSLFVKAFPIVPVGDPLFRGWGDSNDSGGH